VENPIFQRSRGRLGKEKEIPKKKSPTRKGVTGNLCKKKKNHSRGGREIREILSSWPWRHEKTQEKPLEVRSKMDGGTQLRNEETTNPMGGEKRLDEKSDWGQREGLRSFQTMSQRGCGCVKGQKRYLIGNERTRQLLCQ